MLVRAAAATAAIAAVTPLHGAGGSLVVLIQAGGAGYGERSPRDLHGMRRMRVWPCAHSYGRG